MSTDTSNEFRHTAGNASIIAITTAGSAIVGLVLQQIMAYHFGASAVTDSYLMAQNTSELLSKLLMGGSITAVFIPFFVERLTQGRAQDAWNLALNLFHIITAAYLVLLTLLAVFAEPFVRFIAQGFSSDQIVLTTQLLRILLPSFLFLFLVEFFTSMLYSFRIFALPAFMRLIGPSVSIISLILLVSRYGIFALAIGVVIGSLIQFTLLLRGLHQQGMTYRFLFQPTNPAIKKLLLLVYPFIFSVLVTQAAGITYRILVSELAAGSLTAIKYAEKITQLLSNVFLTSVTLVIYPLLSQKAANKDIIGMRDTIGSALRLIFFVTLPVITGVALLRQDIITIAYARGSFNDTDIAMTSIALLYLVLGIASNGLSSTLGYTTLAFQKTKISVLVTILTHLASIAMFYLLVPIMAHAGLALASSLGPLVSATGYFFYLRRRIPNLASIFLHSTYLKTITLTIAMAIIVTLLQKYLLTDSNLYLRSSVLAASGAIFYFTSANILHIPEMKEATTIAASKLAKWRGINKTTS